VAAARKPCLVEKPMAINYAECTQMVNAFRAAGVPLWVAYYRRALPRYLLVRSLLAEGAVGQVTSLNIHAFEPLAVGERARTWRYDPAVAGAGLFFDLASHGVDLLDFLIGPITEVQGFAVNTGGTYVSEDVTAAVFRIGESVLGTGTWNFNSGEKSDGIEIVGSAGVLHTPVFTDGDVVVARRHEEITHHVRNPPHVHQPLIQTIVDELAGRGVCESTGESGARASWVLDQCVKGYYR
jgi:predicted dehydrogenase